MITVFTLGGQRERREKLLNDKTRRRRTHTPLVSPLLCKLRMYITLCTCGGGGGGEVFLVSVRAT